MALPGISALEQMTETGRGSHQPSRTAKIGGKSAPPLSVSFASSEGTEANA